MAGAPLTRARPPDGNSNLCQQGLPSATETKYCGA
jgi:hypothetical protein